MKVPNPDSIFDLDLGPWAYDFVTNSWATLDGRLARPGWLSARNLYRPPRWRSTSIHSSGYVTCGGPFVHQVVARAWIYKPDSKLIVNHKDGNKQNNHVYNLEWVDYSRNIKHAYDHKLRSTSRTPELVDVVRRALSANQRYWGASKIASEFNVCLSLVKTIASEIRNGN